MAAPRSRAASACRTSGTALSGCVRIREGSKPIRRGEMGSRFVPRLLDCGDQIGIRNGERRLRPPEAEHHLGVAHVLRRLGRQSTRRRGGSSRPGSARQVSDTCRICVTKPARSVKVQYRSCQSGAVSGDRGSYLAASSCTVRGRIVPSRCRCSSTLGRVRRVRSSEPPPAGAGSVVRVMSPPASQRAITAGRGSGPG